VPLIRVEAEKKLEFVKKNGAGPEAMKVNVSTSFLVERTGDGRKVMKVYALAMNPQGLPMVLGEAVLDVPNLDIGKVLAAGIAQMIAQQGPEITLAKPSL
jgi:hypothetical protein